jgi:hypothetical protein
VKDFSMPMSACQRVRRDRLGQVHALKFGLHRRLNRGLLPAFWKRPFPA